MQAVMDSPETCPAGSFLARPENDELQQKGGISLSTAGRVILLAILHYWLLKIALVNLPRWRILRLPLQTIREEYE